MAKNKRQREKNYGEPGKKKENKGPVIVFRDGVIRVSVWLNDRADGNAWYSAQPERSYKAGDTWKRTYSFGTAHILIVAELMRQAYLWIRQQEGNEFASPRADASDMEDEEGTNPFLDDGGIPF